MGESPMSDAERVAERVAEKTATPLIRRRARWQRLTWLQLLISFSILTVFCVRGIDARSWPWIDLAFFSLLVWLCEVLGFWLGLGSHLRRVAMVAVLAPIPGLMGSFAVGGELVEFQVFCLGVFGVVAITTGALRWFRGKLRIVSEAEGSRDGLQFGIQHVMIWTAILAALFGVSRYLVRVGVVDGNVGDLSEILLLASTMSACAVASVWAILSLTIHPVRLLAMAAVVAAAAAITYWVSQWWIFAAATVTAQALLWATLGMLRQAGYRFVRSDV